MRLALYQPDIPQNTGTILRMAACLGVAADIIQPTGFDISDRSLKRAGLDYLAHVDMTRHASWQMFELWRSRAGSPRLVLLTVDAQVSHLEHGFRASDIILLGRESAGVPEPVHQAADARIRVPMQPGLRSLNVAVTAAIVLGEALRQTGGFPAQT